MASHRARGPLGRSVKVSRTGDFKSEEEDLNCSSETKLKKELEVKTTSVFSTVILEKNIFRPGRSERFVQFLQEATGEKAGQ